MQSPPKYSPQETAERGMKWYDNGIRQQLEVEANLGKFLALDVDTGQYVLADNLLIAANTLKSSLPQADMFAIRIGYPTVHKMGGTLLPFERFRK